MIVKISGRLLVLLLFHCVFPDNTCFSQKLGQTKIYFDSCRLNIYSPFGCNYVIFFDGKGNSKIEEFTDNAKEDSLLSSRSFEFTRTDLKHLDLLLQGVKGADTVRSLRMVDTYGYSLYIDGKKFIDVYGQNDKIESILKILVKYRTVLDEKCGFFKLFKKMCCRATQRL